MCNTTKETKEFFMFSYFGILPIGLYDDKYELKDKFGSYQNYVAYKCSYRAYLDVCRAIKYSITTAEIEQDKKENKENKKETWKEFKELKRAFITYEIKIILDNLCNLLSASDFDNKHKEICRNMLLSNDSEKIKNVFKTIQDEDKKEKIKNVFNTNYLFKKGCEFKYGMAQKWLNMTIKNLLLAEDMFNGCTGYGNILEENRAKFHVPVDKNILKAAKSLGINKILDKTYSIEGWSNWEEPTYTEFIRLLKDKLQKTSMLDWEHSAWMENAE